MTLFDPRNPKHRASLRRDVKRRIAVGATLGLPPHPCDERKLAMVDLLDELLGTGPRKRRTGAR